MSHEHKTADIKRSKVAPQMFLNSS